MIVYGTGSLEARNHETAFSGLGLISITDVGLKDEDLITTTETWTVECRCGMEI